MTPMDLKKLNKKIDAAYSVYMDRVQVNMMDLSKVSNLVRTRVIEGKTIEEAYAEARAIYEVK